MYMQMGKIVVMGAHMLRILYTQKMICLNHLDMIYRSIR